jgi:hypothetical protein
MLRFVYGYINVTQFDNYMLILHLRFVFTLVMKIFPRIQFFSHNTVYYKSVAHCVC